MKTINENYDSFLHNSKNVILKDVERVELVHRKFEGPVNVKVRSLDVYVDDKYFSSIGFTRKTNKMVYHITLNSIKMSIDTF